MKLFMFYVGGSFKNANVELHDVRFSIGDTAEACHADLRRQWWGDPGSLHLDCWGEVVHADGYDVALTDEDVVPGTTRLFFVNLGGYDPREFAELHRNVLVVAPDAASAKQKALALTQGWVLPHRDKLFEVESLVDLSEAMAGYGYRLRLTDATAPRPFQFVCTYLPIG
jgi:hypothetical protein